MSSAFETDSPVSTRPFDDDGYLGHDPRLESRRFEEYTNFTDNDSVKDSVDYSSPFGDGYLSQPIPETPSPPSIYTTPGGFQSDQRGHSLFSQELNGNAFDEGFVESDGPILPPPSEMLPEDGFALREWRRENAALLEEKTKIEKELLLDIISEADTYKKNLLDKRKENLVANLRINREKEKIFVANQVKFHAEADKNYWKSIADLVPNEVIAIEKRGKKKQENKPSVVVIQGPKPGKPTDLSRMRQILVKLKHNPPPNMKTSPPPPPTKDAKSGPAAPAKDAKTGSGTAVAPPAPKAVAVA